MDSPLFASPANENISSTQTIASDACQNSSGRQRGSASTASGSSHNEYCGDQTLFVSRNAAITRNASWANRGRRCADRANQPIARQASANRASDSRFTRVGSVAVDALSQMEDLARAA